MTHTENTKYNQRDHIHCFDKVDPPCGIKTTHRCCLCEMPVPTENTKEETMEDRFYKKAKNWKKGQGEACACLGDCKRCGYHKCNGCLCCFLPFIREEINLGAEARVREERDLTISYLSTKLNDNETKKEVLSYLQNKQT